MEFDHIRGKAFNIGTEGKKLDEITLRREMAKCEVVCCNDHAFRTWHRMRGLGLDSTASRNRLAHLPPGASLTPWKKLDTPAKVEGIPRDRTDFTNRPVQSRHDSREVAGRRIPD